jgi:uncharacterized membrane protein YvbJ
LVYCQKCGTKNEDNADFCAKCGANLQTGTQVSHRRERRKAEQDCFGLPNGGAIAGIILGILILIWGLTMILDITFNFWYIILIIFGILMVAGALYKITRPKTNY